MNSDDIVTIDLNNADLGMYPYTTIGGSMAVDTIDLSGCGLSTGSVTIGTYSPTVTLDPAGLVNLNGIDLDLTSSGVGGWYEERRIIDEYNEEKALRENNEGIQKAWEQYKILVELAKNPPEII